MALEFHFCRGRDRYRNRYRKYRAAFYMTLPTGFDSDFDPDPDTDPDPDDKRKHSKLNGQG